MYLYDNIMSWILSKRKGDLMVFFKSMLCYIFFLLGIVTFYITAGLDSKAKRTMKHEYYIFFFSNLFIVENDIFPN